MSHCRYTAVIATVSNAVCDSVLDYSVNRFNYYKVLLVTAIIAMLGQVVIGLVTQVQITLSLLSLPWLILHGVATLIGYIYFVKSLKYIPLALIGLLEASSVFLTFMIDVIIGYVDISLYFVGLLALFVFSIFLFTGNCTRDGIKTLKPIGFVFVLVSILVYLIVPYIIKAAEMKGASEVSINLSYYIVAIPYFIYQYTQNVQKGDPQPAHRQKWGQNFYFLCLTIGLLETGYYFFETISYVNDVPTVVVAISQMRVFLLFLLSVLFKVDRFSVKKLIALILGTISVTGIYLI